MLTRASFLAMVDHTLLRAEATRAEVEAVAAEGRSLGVAAVCVNGLWTSGVAAALAGSGVRTCTVVGFPLGAGSPAAVARETLFAVAEGAEEIDMVVPLGLLRGGEGDGVASYVAGVRAAAGTTVLKVILETATLTPDEIVTGCRIAVAAGADYVKTSTGFHAAGGATVAAVRLLRETVGPDVGVKASGGIRTLADAEAMVDAGASRLGLSATASILAELDASA